MTFVSWNTLECSEHKNFWIGRELIVAGHWHEREPEIWIVADTGYDLPRLAFVLDDLPMVIAGRVRSGRIFRFPAVRVYDPRGGRPPKHGALFALAKPECWPEPAHTTASSTDGYGTAVAIAWDRLHPRLTHRTCWLEHGGKLPIIEGTLLRLGVTPAVVVYGWPPGDPVVR